MLRLSPLRLSDGADRTRRAPRRAGVLGTAARAAAPAARLRGARWRGRSGGGGCGGAGSGARAGVDLRPRGAAGRRRRRRLAGRAPAARPAAPAARRGRWCWPRRAAAAPDDGAARAAATRCGAAARLGRRRRSGAETALGADPLAAAPHSAPSRARRVSAAIDGQFVRPHRPSWRALLRSAGLDVDHEAVVLAEGADVDPRAEIEAHQHRIVIVFALDRFDHRRQRRLGVRQVEAQHRVEGQRQLVPGIVRRDADEFRQVEDVARERRLGDRLHPDRRRLALLRQRALLAGAPLGFAGAARQFVDDIARQARRQPGPGRRAGDRRTAARRRSSSSS